MSDIKEIQPKDVEKHLDANEPLNVIDVRENEEVADGKIPQAKHIPLGELPERIDELDQSKEYIMVCRSGRRSEKAADFLQKKGFKVQNMSGGMLKWEGDIHTP